MYNPITALSNYIFGRDYQKPNLNSEQQLSELELLAIKRSKELDEILEETIAIQKIRSRFRFAMAEHNERPYGWR